MVRAPSWQPNQDEEQETEISPDSSQNRQIYWLTHPTYDEYFKSQKYDIVLTYVYQFVCLFSVQCNWVPYCHIIIIALNAETASAFHAFNNLWLTQYIWILFFKQSPDVWR